MNDFTLTVAFQSPYTETETLPVEINRRSRLWHKLTRKPLPTITQEIPTFYTVELDDLADPEEFEEQATALEIVGYTIASAVAHDGYIGTELVSKYHVPDAEDIAALFYGMCNDSHRGYAYMAYIQEYGWDADSLTEEWMDDHYHGAWQSPGDYVQELVTDAWHESMRDVPDFVSINWDDTADNLSSDYDFVRFYGETHVFGIY